MAQDHLNSQKNIHTQTVAENKPVEEAQQGSLLTINGTILFIAVSFVIFTVIMQRIFYAPLTQIRQKRQDYIRGIKAEATNAQEQAEKLQKDYTEKITATRKKASEKTAEVMEEAKHEKTKILEERKQDVMRFLEEGRHRLHEERHNTFEQLKDNISEYAYQISKKVLNEEIPMVCISKEAIDRAVNR